MTNLEFLKTLKSGEEVENFLHHVHYGCAQAMAGQTEEQRKVWKEHCLLPEYRGENGCRKCTIEFWSREVEGTEKAPKQEYHQMELDLR